MKDRLRTAGTYALLALAAIAALPVLVAGSAAFFAGAAVSAWREMYFIGRRAARDAIAQSCARRSAGEPPRS